MNKLLKRILSVSLSVLMAVSMIVIPAHAEGLEGWKLYKNNNCNGTLEIDNSVYYSGTGSMKIVNYTPKTSNVYIRPMINVNLVKDRKYEFSMMIKAEKTDTFVFLPDGWNKRYSLTNYGKEFDWKNFELQYIASKTGGVDVSFVVEGIATVYVDEFKITDTATGEVVVYNNFDAQTAVDAEISDETEEIPVEVLDESVTALYEKICESSSFSQEAIESVRGAFKYMPVYPAENITIDASGDDWEGYPAMGMPVLSSQITTFNNNPTADIKVEAKFAQDEEAFYLYIEVIDDIYTHVTGESYWTGDCIQLAISELDEIFGSELGLTFDPNAERGEVFGIGFSHEQREKVICVGSRNEEEKKTVYEAKIPWNIKYSKRPSEFLFDFLVCDNDGSGRKYCVELAPGIAYGKINDEFPLMEVLSDNNRDWYAWVECPGTAYLGEELKFQYFIVNSGEEKTFSVTDSFTGESKSIKIPANSGVRHEVVSSFDEVGKVSFSVDIVCDGQTMHVNDSCNIEKMPADAEFGYALSKKIRGYADEIKGLIEQCEAMGLDPQYERIAWTILDLFPDYVIQDIEEFEQFYRMHYTDETTEEIYKEAKAALEAYIAGEKVPFDVPRYIQSDVTIDGQVMYATTENKGIREQRPVFFVGAMQNEDCEAYLKERFYDLGFNLLDSEIGPSQIMSNGVKWVFTNHNSAGCTYSITDDGPDENSSAVSFKYTSEVTPNQFYSMYQSIPVEPGKTYVFSGKIKTENAEAVEIAMNDYENRIYPKVGTHDWESFSGEYTVPEGKTSLTYRFMICGPADAVYFSNISVKEKSGGANSPELVADGSFNDYGNIESFVTDYTSNKIKEIIAEIGFAEENNLAVTFLPSPHHFFKDVIKRYELEHPLAGSFTEYNVSHPIIREIYERFLREIIPILRDYKCINSFCISNEPQYDCSTIPEFYTKPWQDWLRERYNNDISELNRYYKSDYTSFDEIELKHDLTQKAHTYDFNVFNNLVFGEWHKFMYDIIKELAPDIPISLKFIGWTRSFSEPESQLRGQGLEAFDYIDLNTCDYSNYIDDGLEHLAKLYWYDFMSSYKNVPVVDAEDHIVKDDAASFYPLELSDYAEQVIYQGAIHGRAVSNIWLYARHKHNSARRESFLYRPDCMYKLGRAALDLNRLSYEIAALVEEPAEIGIISSSADRLFNIAGPYASYLAYESTLFLGQKPRFAVDSKPEAIHDFKAIIVPNIIYLSVEQINELKKFIDNGGKVFVMGTDSLSKTERDLEQDPELVKYILDNSYVVEYQGSAAKMNNMSKAEFIEKLYNFIDDAGLSYVEIKNAETGERMLNVECNVSSYDGKVIVNLANCQTDEKKIKVYLGGELVTESVELRSGEALGDTVTVGCYGSITLAIDKGTPFVDTLSHWAEKDIAKLHNENIIYGVSSSRYAPESTTTRAEFLALLIRAAGISESAYNGGISDVKAEDWYAEVCSAAVEAGIIKSGENFRPNDKITREEMCEMLVTCFENQKGIISISENASFKDTDKISNITAVEKAVSANLMVGNADGTFSPSDTATRAEAAAVIKRYMN